MLTAGTPALLSPSCGRAIPRLFSLLPVLLLCPHCFYALSFCILTFPLSSLPCFPCVWTLTLARLGF